ncbi:endonuclease domain-containing protein [Isoptericola hypogeus]|uniref:endonuclease domain-containing protein n=1 Tax=Isoptericola hypogeus TaxID=300179 RepID=UPI0031DD67B2
MAPLLDDGVAFSHTTALRLLGVEIPWTVADDTRIHAVTSRVQDRPQRGGDDIVAHWSRQTFLETVELEGLLVTSPAQTFVHVGAGLLLPDDVVVLGDAMMRRKGPLVTPAELAGIAERTHKVKGIVRVREQVERMCPGTDSSTETRTRLALTAANLPCPEVNGVVTAPDGTYVKRVDMLYRALKVAIEYDGDQHRTDPAQWRDDVRRRRMLEALGWTVIVVVADDLRDPTELVARVRVAIRRARAASPLL